MSDVRSGTVGVVIVAHGALAAGLEAAVRSILPGVTQLTSVGIDSDAAPDESRAAITAAMARVETGHGILLVVDVYGATPCNVCLPLHQPHQVEILAGANLPVLLKICGSAAGSALETLLTMLRDYGKKTIFVYAPTPPA